MKMKTETHILLPGNHSLQLRQTEHQDDVVVEAVETPTPRLRTG